MRGIRNYGQVRKLACESKRSQIERVPGFGLKRLDAALAQNDIGIAEDISDPEAPFIVGTGSVLRMSVTVPGGAQLSAAALCQGMVATTHQKRGLYAKGLVLLALGLVPIVNLAATIAASLATLVYCGVAADWDEYLWRVKRTQWW